MVAPRRSQVRVRRSLAHWAYFALLRAQRARVVRPLGLRGSLLDSATTAGSCPAKSLLFPEGKRGARRPPPVAETGRSKPSETGNIASALCARSEATMLNCGTVSRRSRDGGIVQTTAQERLLFFTDSQISAAARAHWATSRSAPVRGRTARYAGGGNRARSGCNGAACARFHPIRCPGGNRPAWRSPPD